MHAGLAGCVGADLRGDGEFVLCCTGKQRTFCALHTWEIERTPWHMGTGPIQLQFQLPQVHTWAPCGAREKRRCVRLRLGGCPAFLASSVYMVEVVGIWDGGLDLWSHVLLLSVLRCDLSWSVLALRTEGGGGNMVLSFLKVISQVNQSLTSEFFLNTNLPA